MSHSFVEFVDEDEEAEDEDFLEANSAHVDVQTCSWFSGSALPFSGAVHGHCGMSEVQHRPGKGVHAPKRCLGTQTAQREGTIGSDMMHTVHDLALGNVRSRGHRRSRCLHYKCTGESISPCHWPLQYSYHGYNLHNVKQNKINTESPSLDSQDLSRSRVIVSHSP